jgi:hypothetical protein
MRTYTKRELLLVTLPVLGFLIANIRGLAKSASEKSVFGRRRLNWQSFVDRVVSLSKSSLDAGVRDQARYVRSVEALAQRLDRHDSHFQNRGGLKRFRDGYPEFLELQHKVTVEIKLLVFTAGDTIDAHDHPDMTGVMMCLGVKLAVESFDPAGPLESSGNILLRRIEKKVLAEGAISTLTAHVGNIHRLEADADCDLLDVLTPPYDARRTADMRWYSIDLSSFDAMTGACRARAIT